MTSFKKHGSSETADESSSGTHTVAQALHRERSGSSAEIEKELSRNSTTSELQRFLGLGFPDPPSTLY